ncbi:MAG: tetratricopeptide repeat-containing glycosyltransferase family protein [Parcubacteria group bacterium]
MSFEQAKICHERGQIQEAIKLYDELLNVRFDDVNVLVYYGTALIQMGKTGLAANVLMQASVIDPRNVDIMQNLSNCYKLENKTEAAEEILRMALKIKETPELWGSLGNIYINSGTPHKALDCYDRGLKLQPNNDMIKFHKGLAYLELGMWEKGWEGYEHGFQAGNRNFRDYRGLPVWDGAKDRTVIVWGEQGVGDELMFMSVLPDLMRDSKRVILDCHPRLVKTFERTFGIEVHGTRKNQVLDWMAKSDADCHCSITTVAAKYRKADADFPKTPYLIADDLKVQKHRNAGDGRLRVGISWTGGVKPTRKDLRSFKLEALLPILKQNCDFYSLQYTPESAREVCELEEQRGVRVKHYPNFVECFDYDETINFIASMDLVISVCTTAIHAAGGLGIPVWIMTPSKPAWRYGVTGENAWYGSARTFRQKPGETWAPVIYKISEELNERIKRGEQRAA